MEAWWTGLDSFEKVFWAVAIVFSVFFILQLIFTFMGGDDIDAGGMDADMGSDGDMDGGSFLGFFTIRNMVSFFLGFSWFGLACLEKGLSKSLTVVIAVACGTVTVALVMLLMKGLSSMKSSGTLSLKNAVGQEGTVTIAVPENMSGRGKVNLVMQGRLVELEAATKGDRLGKGEQIKVVETIGDQTLVIEKLNNATVGVS